MSAIISAHNLTFGYHRATALLRNLSFEVPPGTFLAIAGPNGAGKTTLLNLLCGTLRPRKGRIIIDSKPVQSYTARQLSEKIAVVRQQLSPPFGFSVIETVMMARTRHFGAAGFESKADRHVVHEAMELTDVARFAARPLASLSSGERQRVFIARAIAQDTPILLLDEPTNFLDLKHQVGVYDLLKTTQTHKGKTIVAVTHDINLAVQYSDRTILLAADRTYLQGPTDQVLCAEKLEQTFGIGVFAGTAGNEKFFIPAGKFAKSKHPPKPPTCEQPHSPRDHQQ